MAQPIKHPPKPLANRTFGLIFAAIFLLIALFPVLFGAAPRNWALIVAGSFAAVSIVVPILLTPLNRAWAKFGMLMHKITNPLLMGLVFFLTVLPTGLIMKALGKDPMRRKQKPKEASYWIERETKQITPESFDTPF